MNDKKMEIDQEQIEDQETTRRRFTSPSVVSSSSSSSMPLNNNNSNILVNKYRHLRDTGLLYVLVPLASFQLIHMLVNVNYLLLCVYNLIRLLMTIFCIVSFHTWLHIMYGSVLNLTEKNVYFLFVTCLLGELCTQIYKRTGATEETIEGSVDLNESFQGTEHVLVVAFLFLATNYVSYGRFKENSCLVLALSLTRLYGAVAFSAILPHAICVYFTYICALVGILFSFYLNNLLASDKISPQTKASLNKGPRIKYIRSLLNIRDPANYKELYTKTTKFKRNKQQSKETLSVILSKRRTSLPTIPSKPEKSANETSTSDYESGESPTNSDYNSDTDKLNMRMVETRSNSCHYHEMLSARRLQQIKDDLAGLKIKSRAASSSSSSSCYPPESAKKMWKPSDLDDIELLDQLDTWSYPIFELYAKSDQNILSHMAYKIFVKTGLFEAFKIPVEPFIEFFTSLENGYLDLAYHNKIHAADVLHACYFFTTQNVPRLVSKPNPSSKFFTKQRNLDWTSYQKANGNCIAANMSPLEVLALFCSAAMHDYEHPGRNNQFLIATSSPLAMLYNDKSVLENHHAAASWRLLKSAQKYNFLTSLEADEWKRFRTLILENILATDLGRHFSIIEDFNVKVNQSKNNETSRPINWDNEAERLLVSEIILKLADINAPLKSTDLHLAWTDRIVQEFYEQGDEERERDMPISAYMDRRSPLVSKLQESFMNVLVGSLCKSYSQSGLMPGSFVDNNGGDGKVFYSEMENNFEQNYNMWCEKIKQESEC